MTYEIEVRHSGLHKYRVIKGPDHYVVQQKAQAQVAAWEEMWERKLEAEERKAERERLAQDKEEKKAFAAELTAQAQEAIREMERILDRSLGIEHAIDWEQLKDKRAFPKAKPSKPFAPTLPPTPPEHEKPRPSDKPNPHDPKYTPQFTFLDRLFAPLKRRRIERANAKLREDIDTYNRRANAWNTGVRDWHVNVKRLKERYAAGLNQYESDVAKWKSERRRFIDEQDTRNAAVEGQRRAYAAADPAAIYDYCDMVLSNSAYPDEFPQSFELEYIPENKTLIVEYSLPGIEVMPAAKSVRYVQSEDKHVESKLSNAALNKLYDTVLYQITLRSVHELYSADLVKAIDSIVFNGWVTAVDQATGQERTTCVLSVQVGRDEFADIELSRVDPKACFRKLKGVGSAKLHCLSAVAPILQMSREDKRFTSSYAVAEGVDDSMNLALMDWEDFEHLVRELFEKEFSVGGGEVKVTQASRDGGVDAIAFDPDPIRGGKIAIQAKRYTNVVGVAAVRDLYGTVMNEGANKGILVTTSTYGPDAYEFAKGKPLTLLDGSNLLHLLEKHGHRARIDLKEAKRILRTSQNAD